jgi:hypothetical protein
LARLDYRSKPCAAGTDDDHVVFVPLDLNHQTSLAYRKYSCELSC